jgi:outer membrane biosynthesis protein TonB
MEPIQINIKVTVEFTKETVEAVSNALLGLLKIAEGLSPKKTLEKESYDVCEPMPEEKPKPEPKPEEKPIPEETPDGSDPFAGIAEPKQVDAKKDEPSKAVTHEDALKAVEAAKKRGVEIKWIREVLKLFGANAPVDVPVDKLPEFIKKVGALRGLAKKGATDAS